MAAAVDCVVLVLAIAVSGARPFDRIAFLTCAAVGTYGVHRLADVRAVGTADGLTVVNWARRRRLDWAEIVGVRLAPGDPWLQLDVSDGTTVPVMAVQAADGPRGREMALEVAATVAANSPSPERP